MERKKMEHGPLSMDMGFGRPDKAKCLCSKCKYRMPDGVVKVSEERTVVIEQWDNAKCEYYDEKPDSIVWDGAYCKYFKADEGAH